MCKKVKFKNPSLRISKILIITFFITLSASAQNKTDIASHLNSNIQKMLNKFCIDCHDEKKQKGNIRLDNFTKINIDDQKEILSKIEEQVYLKQMPPDDEDVLPSMEEHKAFMENVKQWYGQQRNKSSFREKLDKPEYGNYVDHDELFSGEFKNLKSFTYDRKWLINEYIFDQKMNEIFSENGDRYITVKGKSYKLMSSKAYPNIANPFLLTKHSGIQYYANEELNSGHFMTMLENSEEISAQMISIAKGKYKEYLPAVKTMTSLIDHHNKILQTRKTFLETFIIQLCESIYKDQNQSLLPAYSPIPIEGEINPKSESFKKWGWRNRIGSADGDAFLIALKWCEQFSKSNLDLIKKCDEYWFYMGEDEATRIRRANVLLKELSSILRSGNYRGREVPKFIPLEKSEMEIITSTIKKLRTQGMTYNTLIKKCMSKWEDEFTEIREKTNKVNDSLIADLLHKLYEKLYQRTPSQNELAEKTAVFRSYMSKGGPENAIRKITQTMLLDSQFIFRNEYGSGKEDQYGRRMLSPHDASYAIAYALTDSGPDEELVKAAKEGRLSTREDYKREVQRLLNERNKYYVIDSSVDNAYGVANITNTPIRKIRFFRDFFGYPNATSVFKDEPRLDNDYNPSRLIAEADMLVDHILKQDKNVFENLLTTDKYFVFHNGDNDLMKSYSEQLSKPYEFFKDKGWENFKKYEDVMKYKDFLAKNSIPGVRPDIGGKHKEHSYNRFMNFMKHAVKVSSNPSTDFFPKDLARTIKGAIMLGDSVLDHFNITNTEWSAQQPLKIQNRKGILTHPAWLIAFSQNLQTDPVIRGKFIREKLLARTVPDVPITVDAQIPEDPTKTLRERLVKKTEVSECWRCHKFMNPLGYPFEVYDDFGRYRTLEQLEYPQNELINKKNQDTIKLKYDHNVPIKYKTLPINSKGVLEGTGDAKLDGEVKDAVDMIERLAKSTRVRQSFIRHAFRYFMGRNEMLSDSKTLIDADEAYVKSGGSFDAVIVSLLTSDSFIYRKKIEE